MSCTTKTQNTKSSRCQFDWGKVERTVLTPKGAMFTGLDGSGAEQTFDEWILAGIHAALKTNRFFPMPKASDITDGTEEAKKYTNGTGKEYFIMEGNKKFMQNYISDYCLQNRMASFNDGVSRGILIFDNKGYAWGVDKTTGKSGFIGQVFAETSGVTTQSDVKEPKISYSFDKPKEFVAKVPISTELDVDDLEGLEDVTMVVTTGETNSTIKFYAGCGSEDVTSEMQGIAGKTACWLKDGVAVTTAPTYANGVFTVANSSLANGVKLSIADPSVLYANGVSFKECTTEHVMVIA